MYAQEGPSSAEVCGNDVDEDCDGALDNGFDIGVTCTVGQGACEATGTLICNDAGTGTECNAQAGPSGTEFAVTMWMKIVMVRLIDLTLESHVP